jgi:hypothetical protein
MILILVTGAFTLATALTQRMLQGRKVQSRIGMISFVHLGIALPLLLGLRLWLDADLVGPVLFWAGAGLAWFVVRSHLENSILLAMLEYVAQGFGDRDDLLHYYNARHGFLVRLKELNATGLISDDGREPPVTWRGRLALTFFGWLGGKEEFGRLWSTEDRV